MSALTSDRHTQRFDGIQRPFLVAGGVRIFSGSLVVVNASGYAEPGRVGVGLKAAGRAGMQVDNSAGADGAATVVVERLRSFLFGNAGDIDQSHLLSDAYIVDDQTVSASSATGARSRAGKIVGIEPNGVWIEFG